MNAILAAAESDAVTSWFFVLCLLGGLAVAVVWLFLPFFLFARLKETQSVLERLEIQVHEAREAHFRLIDLTRAQVEATREHKTATETLNSDLNSYGASTEQRFDVLISLAQSGKFPGQ